MTIRTLGPLGATVLIAGCLSAIVTSIASSADVQLRDQELATRLEVGYAVRILDMNGDNRPDIAIVDSKRFLWLENPNWNEHVIHEDKEAKFDNVCFAPYDINADGRLDFAVGRDWQANNTEGGGEISWLEQGANPNEPWTMHFIANEPTVHRMQFVDVDDDGKAELIVSPLKGRQTTAPNFAEAGVRQLAFPIPANPKSSPWQPWVLNDTLHVTHNFWPIQWDLDPTTEFLFVSFEGVHLLDRQQGTTWSAKRIGEGEQSTSPNRGASEIKFGKLQSGSIYIATIEPWHGDRVVAYTAPTTRAPFGSGLWTRQVIDAELKWGHAVACANLDGDAEEELIIGVRDDLDASNPAKRRGLRIYDPTNAQGTAWSRQIVDPGSVAIEDLAAGDLNQDGRIDIVAVGRATHNVKIYWNETK